MAERNENILTNLGTEFTKELEVIVKQVLTNTGVKNNSDLTNSIEFQYGRNETLYMYVNDYYENVSKGRKPLAKKIPIYALIQWIKDNGISSSKYPIGRLAYIIQASIYKNGIKGKNFLEQVEESVLDSVEIKVADDLERFVGDSLYSAFTVK